MSVKSPIHRGDMDGYGWIWCIIQGVYMGLPNRKNMLGKPNHKDILVKPTVMFRETKASN
jgi:hypothetical protein